MEFPCPNCISFAICKLKEVSYFSDEHPRVVDTINLRKDCILFKNWYYENPRDSKIICDLFEADSFFF